MLFQGLKPRNQSQENSDEENEPLLESQSNQNQPTPRMAPDTREIETELAVLLPRNEEDELNNDRSEEANITSNIPIVPIDTRQMHIRQMRLRNLGRLGGDSRPIPQTTSFPEEIEENVDEGSEERDLETVEDTNELRTPLLGHAQFFSQEEFEKTQRLTEKLVQENEEVINRLLPSTEAKDEGIDDEKLDPLFANNEERRGIPRLYNYDCKPSPNSALLFSTGSDGVMLGDIFQLTLTDRRNNSYEAYLRRHLTPNHMAFRPSVFNGLIRQCSFIACICTLFISCMLFSITISVGRFNVGSLIVLIVSFLALASLCIYQHKWRSRRIRSLENQISNSVQPIEQYIDQLQQNELAQMLSLPETIGRSDDEIVLPPEIQKIIISFLPAFYKELEKMIIQLQKLSLHSLIELVQQKEDYDSTRQFYEREVLNKLTLLLDKADRILGFSNEQKHTPIDEKSHSSDDNLGLEPSLNKDTIIDMSNIDLAPPTVSNNLLPIVQQTLEQKTEEDEPTTIMEQKQVPSEADNLANEILNTNLNQTQLWAVINVFLNIAAQSNKGSLAIRNVITQEINNLQLTQGTLRQTILRILNKMRNNMNMEEARQLADKLYAKLWLHYG